ncbi:MAG: radical SAM family heme chaperone HemW [Phycisphaerae bacterium]|nr:radical SAM family heme chaperone HemW [Phycisphaerae bacterium]
MTDDATSSDANSQRPPQARSAAGPSERVIGLAMLGGQMGGQLGGPLERGQTAAEALRRVAPGSARVRGVYVHVPFCFHKCHYCDFYSFVDREDRQPAYVHRLLREADAGRAAGVLDGPIETVFVGGGTPTFLRPELLRALLTGLAERLPLQPVTRGPDGRPVAGLEWTVEANPETVTDEVAEILVSSGVNRVSVGVQSFHPAHLKTLERWHDPASVGRAVERLRRAGIRRLNLDLIFGIPGSTLAEWSSDLDRALELGPDHLSCYGLTYEPNTAMTKRLELKQFEACDEDLEAAMYECTLDRLEAAGFEQYEISNFAKPGEACRHNLLYWHNADWWSLGPSGSAHVQGVRWKNVPRLSAWLASESATSPIQDLEKVDEETRAGEILMLGLRLREGLPQSTVDRCCQGPRGAERQAALAAALERGLMERVADRLRFTRAGLLLADEVLAEVV